MDDVSIHQAAEKRMSAINLAVFCRRPSFFKIFRYIQTHRFSLDIL